MTRAPKVDGILLLPLDSLSQGASTSGCGDAIEATENAEWPGRLNAWRG